MPEPLVRSARPTHVLPLPRASESTRLATLEPSRSEPRSEAPPGIGGGRSFRAILTEVATELDARERAVDAALARARQGAGLSPPELLAVQAGVYRYAHELELATKVVDKATGALRQTLESQR